MSDSLSAMPEKNVDEQLVLSHRWKGKYQEIGKIFPQLYKTAKWNAKKNPITMYHDNEPREVADIECCVPLKKEIKTTNFQIKKLPATKCLYYQHIGPYEKLPQAYKKVFEYLGKNKIQPTSSLREVCLKGPGMFFKGNPNNYITEIQVPI